MQVAPGSKPGPRGAFAAGWLTLLVLAATLTSSTGLARAEGGTPGDLRKARELYQQGKEAYAAGRFAEAYAQFEEGFRLSGRPLFLLNMAQAKRRDGALSDARTLCGRLLELEPQSPYRPDVEALIAEIDNALTRAGQPSPAMPTAPVLVAPAPVEAPLSIAARPQPVEGPRLYQRWWVWAAAGAAIAAVTTAVVLSRATSATRNGSLGTLGAP
jgi:tetratricopeptide (TPR) repeat protein